MRKQDKIEVLLVLSSFTPLLVFPAWHNKSPHSGHQGSIDNTPRKKNIKKHFNYMSALITEWPQFFTATNLEWKPLLKPDKYKDIMIDSLRFLVENKKIKIYAFVIMINHIHLIWQMCANINPEAVQRDFLKYTSQKIKADLKNIILPYLISLK